MGFIPPIPAVIVAFVFLGIMLYKRVNLAICLTATAILLALLAVDLTQIPATVYKATDPQTFEGRFTISVVLATFGIMWISQLYKDTGTVARLSENLGSVINNPKIILSALPAVIGFLPVSGGALMSAPIVDKEAEKLKLDSERKTYVNLWFRHTIFPVYPISQPLLATAALTAIATPLIILRQIPVVIVMAIVGFIIGFRGVAANRNIKSSNVKNSVASAVKGFIINFFPIIVTIIVVLALDVYNFDLSRQGFDVLIATIVGLLVLIAIAMPTRELIAKPLKEWGVYAIAIAAYGAFLLRTVIVAAGVAKIFEPLVTTAGVNILLFTLVPGVLGFLTGSPLAGVSITVSILAGIPTFTPATAAIIYISSYLGYVVSPTHLCLTFTAEYFSCPLSKLYKYVIPSFVITYATAILVYLLV